MAVRIRCDSGPQANQILCAAMHPEMPGDIYIDDGLHYYLSVEVKVLVTTEHEQHSKDGIWWWIHKVPSGVKVDRFYEG